MSSNNSWQDHYATLGIEPTADFGTIKRAYRSMALKHHPDKNSPSQSQNATAAFHEITAALEILSNVTTRRDFDRDRKLHVEAAARAKAVPAKAKAKADHERNRRFDFEWDTSENVEVSPIAENFRAERQTTWPEKLDDFVVAGFEYLFSVLLACSCAATLFIIPLFVFFFAQKWKV